MTIARNPSREKNFSPVANGENFSAIGNFLLVASGENFLAAENFSLANAERKIFARSKKLPREEFLTRQLL